VSGADRAGATHDGRPSAAVIGGVAWNTLVQVPRLPTDLTTLHATSTREGIGGTGAGKALHLARLGFDVRLHALLGDDEQGEHVRAALADAGVLLTSWSDPAGTERHLNLMDPHGDRLSIFLASATEDPDIAADELVRFTEGADVVLVSLTHYARRVMPLLSAAGREVWVDLHDWDGEPSDFHSPFVEHGTHVFVSDVRLDDPRTIAEALVEQGKQLVVVTHGHRGATAFFPDREPLFVLPYDAGAAVDTNGAGDAFCAGVVLGRLRGWDWGRSLEAGAVVAGGCVTSPHLADPALNEEWLRDRLSR
jgi:sugar/nucleoside kinase (ribokinase family)